MESQLYTVLSAYQKLSNFPNLGNLNNSGIQNGNWPDVSIPLCGNPADIYGLHADLFDYLMGEAGVLGKVFYVMMVIAFKYYRFCLRLRFRVWLM